MKFDEFLFSHLGEMGKYQKIQFTLVCLPTIFCSMHALSWTFAGIHQPNRCALGEEANGDKYSGYWNGMGGEINRTEKCVDAEWSAVSPSAPGARCMYQECEWNSGKNDTSCPSTYIFDNSRVAQSAMGRWDIVCKRGWIKATIQSAYYIGQMAGSMTFGVLGDRIGRKKCFFIAIALQIVCGLAQSIAPTWWIYVVFRAGTGFSHPGIFVIANVIGMELVGPRYRKLASVITGLFFAVGQIILGVVAVNVTDYQWLHVATTAPALLFLSYWWLVPESARWLVSVRRFQEADKVLQNAAKTNGVTLPDKWWTQLDGEEEKTKEEEELAQPVQSRQYGFADLMKTPELRKRALVVFYLWPVVSMVYYGLSMKSDILGGDIYINFIIGGFIEMPSLFLVFLFIDRIGRRIVLTIGYGLAGICLLSNLAIPDTAPHWIALIQLLISRGAITATYAGIYMFSPELFPTVVRNSAMGVCSTIARVGAITASFMAMWISDKYGKAWMIIPFGVMSIMAAVLIILFLPETMGKPLPATIEEIEDSADELVEVQMERLTKDVDEETGGN